MENKAKIYTYSIIYTASLDFADKVPFAVAVVESQENGRFMTFVEGYEEGKKIEVGMEVEFSRMNQDGNPIYKFIQ